MKKVSLYFFACISLLFTMPIYPLVIAKGNSDSKFSTFNTTVYSKVFDRATGTLYLGLMTGANEFAIAKARRVTDGSQPIFTGIATKTSSPNVNDKPIELLTLATEPGSTNAIIAGVVGTDPLSLFPNNFAGKAVFTLSPAGTQGGESATLLDANGAVGVNGNPTAGIWNIAASEHFIFALLRPQGSFLNPMTHYTGVAVVKIDPTTLSLTQVAAVPGDTGIKSQQLDPTSDVLKIGADVTIRGLPSSMYWDDYLKRLYIGLLVNPGGSTSSSGARSTTVGHLVYTDSALNTDGKLVFEKIAPDDAFTTNRGNIVGVKYDDTSGLPNYDYSVRNTIKTMHTSTGPSYLIVQGGVTSSVGGDGNSPIIPEHKIFALPLVDKGDPTDAQQGILADKNSYSTTNRRFETPATTNAHLVDEANPDDYQYIVGTAFLPFKKTARTASNSEQNVSDLVVVDDTVYVTINTGQTDTNETGIFYSQAQFDHEGKIIGWTPWERAFPYCGSLCTGSAIRFFEVDAVTGSIWAIHGSVNLIQDGTTSTPQTPGVSKSRANKIVSLTRWNHGDFKIFKRGSYQSVTTSLVAQLNNALPCGCTAVLDLDYSTRGFSATPHRYALFGGSRTIVFARISESRASGPPYDYWNDPDDEPANYPPKFYPQEVVTNFSYPENFLVSQLPSDAACITTLEYARRFAAEENTNYFFAGTTDGLYVFAVNDGGFNVATLAELNEAPFSTGRWQKAPNITGNIIDIKTAGNVLYVLTSTTNSPRKNILHKIEFQNNVTDMFDQNNIFTLAETSSGIFSAIKKFNSIQLLPAADDFSAEQLLLATSGGLFLSNTPGGVQAATNQNESYWTNIRSSIFSGIGAADTHTALVNTDPNVYAIATHKAWPFSTQKLSTNTWCQGSTIHQLNSYPHYEEVNQYQVTNNTLEHGFIPEDFNGKENVAGFPPINYFWSDGARRFFIVNPPQDRFCTDNACKNNLLVFPYNNIEWNVTNPLYHMLHHQTLRAESNFYWIRHIGASGILMAGTNNGVVALE